MEDSEDHELPPKRHTASGRAASVSFMTPQIVTYMLCTLKGSNRRVMFVTGYIRCIRRTTAFDSLVRGLIHLCIHFYIFACG